MEESQGETTKQVENKEELAFVGKPEKKEELNHETSKKEMKEADKGSREAPVTDQREQERNTTVDGSSARPEETLRISEHEASLKVKEFFDLIRSKEFPMIETYISNSFEFPT